MKTTVLLCFWCLVTPPPAVQALDAGPKGWVSVAIDQGHLEDESVYWSPEPRVEARLWHPEDATGAGWLRVGGLQVGPLEGRPAGDGERAWGPATGAGPGHWGADLDLGAAEGWAVQTPKTLAVGGQLRGRWGAGSGILGADRLWSTGFEVPDSGPWIDRYRGGLTWSPGQPQVLAGWEGRLEVPARGTPSWATQGRAQARGEGFSLGARLGTEGQGGRLDLVPWRLEVGLGAWTVGWNSSGEPRGQGQVSWSQGTWTLRTVWRPEHWVRPGGEWRLWYQGWKLSLGLDATGRDRWNLDVDARVAGHLGGGAVALGWQFDSTSARQVWEVRGGAGPWTTVLRWKVVGLAWGWIGPDSETTLDLRWSF